jgi:DNA modification methylase
LQLAENVIRYYSFEGDVVLDPFAGTGTVGIAALKWQRRFVLFEYQQQYVQRIDETMRRLMPESFDLIDHLTNHDLIPRTVH